MSELSPEPVPEPGGFLAHIEHWVQQHVVPELEAVKADSVRLVTFAEAHAANATQLANIVVAALKAIDPALAPGTAALVAEAEKAAAEADRIARELLGKM